MKGWKLIAVIFGSLLIGAHIAVRVLWWRFVTFGTTPGGCAPVLKSYGHGLVTISSANCDGTTSRSLWHYHPENGIMAVGEHIVAFVLLAVAAVIVLIIKEYVIDPLVWRFRMHRQPIVTGR